MDLKVKEENGYQNVDREYMLKIVKNILDQFTGKPEVIEVDSYCVYIEYVENRCPSITSRGMKLEEFVDCLMTLDDSSRTNLITLISYGTYHNGEATLFRFEVKSVNYKQKLKQEGCIMLEDVLLFSNVSKLRHHGTTNFFRALQELSYVKGVLKLKGSEYYVIFKPYTKLSVENKKQYVTISSFLSSVLPSIKISSLPKGIIRAETEKVDYRTKSDPKLFSYEVICISAEKTAEIFNLTNTIMYNNAFAEDYKALEESIESCKSKMKINRQTPTVTSNTNGKVKKF